MQAVADAPDRTRFSSSATKKSLSLKFNVEISWYFNRQARPFHEPENDESHFVTNNRKRTFLIAEISINPHNAAMFTDWGMRGETTITSEPTKMDSFPSKISH